MTGQKKFTARYQWAKTLKVYDLSDQVCTKGGSKVYNEVINIRKKAYLQMGKMLTDTVWKLAKQHGPYSDFGGRN